MSRPRTITAADLTRLLRSRAPISATELAAIAGVNRTTVVRTLASLGPTLVTMGAGRRTRYALRRAVYNCGNQWPVYQVDALGNPSLWLTIESLHDQLWRVRWADRPPAWASHFSNPEGLWEGYPFFLADCRPQGFLGRAIARQVARTQPVPDDPRRWGDDDTMTYLQSEGLDLPGNLLVGDEVLRRALGHVRDAEEATQEQFPWFAADAASCPHGTSAGGEQPKFATCLRDPAGTWRHVLVKFSPPLDQATGRRWGDLLLAEWHALTILARAGLALPGARILDASGRRFLEVPRFDRTPTGGRRGVVSLEALHAAGVGTFSREWTDAMQNLVAVGLTDETQLATVRRLQAFGELIGNSDMHFGNLAFWLDDALPFRVAPAYDMVPMLWAPTSQGELSPRTFAPLPPVPAALQAWQEAAEWALEFWRALAQDPRLSEEFTSIARSALAALERMF